jgi:hypothetical protein
MRFCSTERPLPFASGNSAVVEQSANDLMVKGSNLAAVSTGREKIAKNKNYEASY